MMELRWRGGQATAEPARVSVVSLCTFLTGSLLCSLIALAPMAAAAQEKVTQKASMAHNETAAQSPAARTRLSVPHASAREVEITVRRGDTLSSILVRQGIAAPERLAVLEALGDLFDPAALRSGDKIRLTLDRQDGRRVVRSISLATGKTDDLTVDVEPGQGLQLGSPDQPPASRTALASADANVEQEIEDATEAGDQPAGQAAASASQGQPSQGQPSGGQPSGSQPSRGHPSEGQFVVRRVAGIAGRDFRRALTATRLPAPLVKEVLLAFKYDPDAPRVPPQNAAFSVIYEGVLQDGKVQEPQLRYATLNDGHKTHRVYRYQTDDATTAFIHADGQGIALVDLARPLRIDAKITSPYGWRIHPVFGDRRFHEGVDFGAPKGTPVIAAADGRVDDIGWRGNYGEYIRLEHDSSLATAYAHLAGFAQGLRKGSMVKRGQVIGYVGRTGVATGPHLYYEVIVEGKRVDPLKTPPVVAVSLTGTQLAEFRKFVERAPEE